MTPRYITQSPRGTATPSHGRNAAQRSTKRAHVVAVVKCKVCKIRRKCVNGLCATCIANME